MVREKLGKTLQDIGNSMSKEEVFFDIEHPKDLSNGDYSTNIAIFLSKALGRNPVDIANEIALEITKKLPDFVEKVEVAGPGFINFYLSRKFFDSSLEEILSSTKSFGKGKMFSGEKVMVEYTDPNPFKEFHIGHLMPNVIGESLSRLYEWSGGNVIRACYQGDVGLHVASAIWGMKKLQSEMPKEEASLKEKVVFLGKAYAKGATAYKDEEKAKNEIVEINKKVFEKSDEDINDLYKTGRRWSLDSFEEVYRRLGTKFDYYFFESETGPLGLKIVEKFLVQGIFEKSDGAIVFKGEKHGLHTRVFINSQGLPTYEAKDLGLIEKKFEIEPDLSLAVTVTAREQEEYFRVVLAAAREIFPDLAKKVTCVTHGMLRLPGGKMSSRTGNVITADSLIESVSKEVLKKLKDRSEAEDSVESIAIAAIRYSILRQSLGKDIIFDFEKSLSFEGDSGPYLQYSAVRINSLLHRAKEAGLAPEVEKSPSNIYDIERLLYRFPEIIERAAKEKEPHYLVTYLIEVASAFNSFYGAERIIEGGEEAPFRVSVAKAAGLILKNGLSILGIRVPERM